MNARTDLTLFDYKQATKKACRHWSFYGTDLWYRLSLSRDQYGFALRILISVVKIVQHAVIGIVVESNMARVVNLSGQMGLAIQ